MEALTRLTLQLLPPHPGIFPLSSPNLLLHPDSFSGTKHIGAVGFQVFIVGVFQVAG